MKKNLVHLIIIIAMMLSCTMNNKVDLPEGADITFEYRELKAKDSIYKKVDPEILEIKPVQVEKGDIFQKITFTISNQSDLDFEGAIRFNLNVPSENPSFFMPGFIYGTNRAHVEIHPKNKKRWPRLRMGKDSVPYSNNFFVRSDRLAYPVSMVYTQNMFYGISGSPYQVEQNGAIKQWKPLVEGELDRFHGYGCKLGHYKSIISYTLGYENAPWLYACPHVEYQKFENKNCIKIPSGGTRTIEVYVYAFESEDERGQTKILKHQNELFHEPPAKKVDPKTAMNDLATALFEDAYNEEVKSYPASLSYINDSVIMSDMFSIGWTGGIQAATPLLMAAIRMERNDMREQAVESIQNMVDNSLNPKSGLPFDAIYEGKWTTGGWWEIYIWKPLENISAHSSYVVGQGLYYVLKAYEVEKQLKNVEHTDWLEFVKNVSNKIETTKNSEHEYPYRWSPETGEAIDYDAMGGVWCLTTRAYLASLLNDSVMLKQAGESIDHYWSKFVKKMECYGSPHDTWMATEEEGSLGFIKAAAILHRHTGEKKYLEYLRDGIDYEFTWKYCYNVKVQVPPLSKLNWSSSGSSGTSIANPCTHGMGSIIADDVLYLYEETGEEYYKQRLTDMLYWNLQSYNTYHEEFDHGKKGWLPESFSLHEASIHKYPDGSPSSIWFIYHPWAAGSFLESLSGNLWENEIIYN